MEEIQKRWKSWHYKNTSLLLVSLVALYYLANKPTVDNIIRSVGELGYLGAFITGIFFVSTFTVAPAAVVLYHLADYLHPLEVALLAGAGAMVGDYIIFRFMKDRIFDELRPLLRLFKKMHVKALFKSPYFGWVLPFTGALIIASPFPDEVGVSMLGMSKVRTWQFFLLALCLNAVGIFLIVTAARAL